MKNNILGIKHNLKDYCNLYKFVNHNSLKFYILNYYHQLPNSHLIHLQGKQIYLLVENILYYPPSILFPNMNFPGQSTSLRPISSPQYLCSLDNYCDKWGLIPDRFTKWLVAAGEPFDKILLPSRELLCNLNTQPVLAFPVAKQRLFNSDNDFKLFLDCFYPGKVFLDSEYRKKYHAIDEEDIINEYYTNIGIGDTYKEKKVFGIIKDKNNNYNLKFCI